MAPDAPAPPQTTPEEYRRLTDLSLEEAARQVGVCRDHLRRAELHGCTPLLAERLAALYRCPVDLIGCRTPPACYLTFKQGKPRMINRGSCGFCNEGAGLKASR